jgi:isopentenyl phosphate kinase
MKNLILIKLGGSIITDKKKDFTVREANILRLGKEIKSAIKTGKCKVIIGHGAGSFAHVPAKKYKTKEGLINRNSLYGMAVTEDAARKLNAIVIKNFLEIGLPVFSFSPASFLISDAKEYIKSYLDPLKIALQIGIIPVVYGDVVIDKKVGCTIFSTEKILSILAKEFLKDYKIRIIYVTNVDGVYDQNKKTIEKITPANFNQVKNAILGGEGTDVTGGMLHKVEESLKLAKDLPAGRQGTGIKTLIINGTKKGVLKNSILNQKTEGTLIN